jgi:mitotic spindle assembly checkpoint protein MAD2B
MLKGGVDRVALVIFSQYAQPLERFMFDVSKFPVVAREDFHTPIERQTPTTGGIAQPRTTPTKPPSVDLEEQFRAVLSKLTVCGTMLKPIPEGCTYTVAIEFKDMSDPPIGHPQPWIPVEPPLQREIPKEGSEGRSGSALGGIATIPIRSVDAGEMVFEMWIEEGAAKEGAGENEDEDGATSSFGG